MRAGGLVSVLAAVTLAATGCGSSGASSTSAPSAQSSSAGNQKSLARFRQCLAQRGVSLPGPGAGNAAPSPSGSGPPPGSRKGFKACQKYAPSQLPGLGGQGPGGFGN